jgi:predicted GIY-YIG superfamily endonuclease
MASLGKTCFTGRSGKQYRFRVFPLGTRFRKRSGVYVVASRAQGADGGHRHTVLYVGHTEDFSQPLAKHRKAKAFAEQGANCICVQSDESEESRLAKERDLLAAFVPKCND